VKILCTVQFLAKVALILLLTGALAGLLMAS
jgi:hypothetical protein